MKKFIFIAILANLFYSCQNLNTLVNNNTMPQGYETALNMQVEKEKELPQESFYLSDSGIAYFLDMVSGNIKNNVTRTHMEGNAFDLYLGEYIALPTTAYNVSVIASPKSKSYEAFIRGGVFYFRSLYQGKYGFSLEKYGEPAETIVINNKSRYQISAFDLNNLVMANAEEKDLGKLQNSVQAFKILFPDNSKMKDVSMALFNQAVINNDKQLVINESNFLDENFDLTSEEKIRVILGKEETLQNDYALPKKYLSFKTNSPELNEVIKNDIIKRGRPTLEELDFMEECYANVPTRELADALGAFYFRSGNISKGTHYSENKFGILPKALKEKMTGSFNQRYEEQKETSTEESEESLVVGSDFENLLRNGIDYYGTESYAEAILVLEKAKAQITGDSKEAQDVYYLLGNSYYLTSSLEKAQGNFEKISKDNAKYPEVLYKLGDIQFKNGNKSKAERIFGEVSENYPQTVWGRRSIIYLRRLK